MRDGVTSGSEPSLEVEGRPASFEHRTLTQGFARKLVESVGSGVKLVASARKLAIADRMFARDLSEIVQEGRMSLRVAVAAALDAILGTNPWKKHVWEEIRDPSRSQAQRGVQKIA